MAKKKKSRVPAPPARTVQAPKPYHAPRDPRRTRTVFVALAGVIVLAAAGVGIAMALGGPGAIEESTVCKLQSFSDQGRNHISEPSEGFEYNSTPPTSGEHYPQPDAPVIWNVYDQPLDQTALVHNLEHGGVVVQYGSGVSEATVGAIVDWYGDDPRGLVVAPLPPELEEEKPALEGRIAVTAWTHLMTCSAFEEAAFDEFLDRYRGPQGDAPEEFPLDALQPSNQ
ncbi:MAG: DUF3105 domain-containing protein [Gaiellaceae bacterium]